MTETPWPTEWLRGVLEVCVLAVIDRGPTYGYAISAELAAAALGDLKGGTLYPLLTRQKNAGLLEYRWEESPSGPPRKYYRLTEQGQDFLRQLDESWNDLVRAVAAININRQPMAALGA